jgi:Zn-dependent peptidase ImmA (M78 family)
MALERGFKAWSERVAQAMRSELALPPEKPLPVQLLAQHLEIELITPARIEGLPADVLHQLTVVDPSGWSAASFEKDGSPIIIFNDKSSRGRQSSDIAHELAHVIRAHDPSQLILAPDGSFGMRSYDPKQEDEANWLGWTILLPRVALLRCADLKLSTEQIAAEYQVSAQLVEYRTRMTGITKQARGRRK